MEIISNKEEMIFRNEYNGKPSYSLGLSKKDKEGKFINGYIKVNFKKGTDIKNKTKIKIKNAWLDFYLQDKNTIPTLFINEYEIVEEQKEEKQEEQDAYQYMKTKVESDIGQEIRIEDGDLPF